MSIVQLSAEGISARLPELSALLTDAVDGGASVSFLAPLARATADGFWHGVAADVAQGTRVVLVATGDGFEGVKEQIAGCVHVTIATQPNAAHRVEIQKLLVHSAHRRRGVATALMAAAEDAARTLGRTLIVLDTEAGSVAEQLYAQLGYQRVGQIPQFARSSSGALHGTVLFYKQLAEG